MTDQSTRTVPPIPASEGGITIKGPRACECRVCLYAAEVEANLAMLDERPRAFFEEMYSRLCHAEMDRDWALTAFEKGEGS